MNHMSLLKFFYQYKIYYKDINKKQSEGVHFC